MQPLGPQYMVGRDRAAGAIVGKIRAVYKVTDSVAGAVMQDKALGLCTVLRRNGDGAAYDRGDLRHACQIVRKRHLGKRRGACVQPALGHGHHVDHPLVSLARGLAEGEDAVHTQDQPFDAGIGAPEVRADLGQLEARYHPGHHDRTLAIKVAADIFAVGLVRQGDDGVCVGMVDEFLRQECVQQGFDRGIWRLRVDQVLALQGHHILIAQGFARLQCPQPVQAHRGQPRRLDGCHVPARTLDAQNLGVTAVEVGDLGLHRRVAAAMQDQGGVATEKLRRIDPKRQIRIHTVRRIVLDGLVSVGFRPE